MAAACPEVGAVLGEMVRCDVVAFVFSGRRQPDRLVTRETSHHPIMTCYAIPAERPALLRDFVVDECLDSPPGFLTSSLWPVGRGGRRRMRTLTCGPADSVDGGEVEHPNSEAVFAGSFKDVYLKSVDFKGPNWSRHQLCSLFCFFSAARALLCRCLFTAETPVWLCICLPCVIQCCPYNSS